MCDQPASSWQNPRNIGENLNGHGGECDQVEDACLIVLVSCHGELVKRIQKIGLFTLTNKYATTRENMEERIETVWICPLEAVEVDCHIVTEDSGARENLKHRVWRGICAYLSTHNEDTAIGKDKKSGLIPTSSLHNELIEHRYTWYGDDYAMRTWSWRWFGFSSQSFVLLTPARDARWTVGGIRPDKIIII
jgi:hypothetical protein